MNDLEILALIERGELTALSREDLTLGAQFCLRVSAKTPSVLAVVVAKLRKDFITDVTEWSAYCKQHFGLEKAYLHHIHKVGKCLHSVTCYTLKVYAILFHLDFEKQLAITQIPAEQIDSFIKVQTKPLGKMTRAEVRAAVNVYLGHTGTALPAKQEEQLLLPGFGKWLDTATGFEPDSIVRAVDDDDTADRSFRAGCLLLGAAVDYQRRKGMPDTQMLVSLKAALLDEVETIENILAQE